MAAIQAMPVYSMNLFRLPKNLINDLHRLSARLWWGGNDSKQKIHWCKWEKLCSNKSEGGLGLRDLGAFNKTMLAKRCWRLLNQPESLVARVIMGCYYPRSSLLEAENNQSGSLG